MRIESIQLDEKYASQLGLAAFRYERLGKVVALTGPNGGGKSRTLLALQWELSDLGEKYEHFLTPTVNKQGRVLLRNGDHCNVKYRDEYALIKRHIRFDMDLATAIRGKTPWPSILHAHSKNGGNTEFSNAYQGKSGKQAIDRAAYAIYMSAHGDFAARFPEKIQHGEQYQDMVTRLLGLDLKPNYDERGEMIGFLSNRPFSGNDLSDGQQRTIGLIQLIIDHAPKIRNSILLIDEPELHLHPDSLIKTFDHLLALGPAQIFLATHSIPLLAHVGIKSVYHLANGKAKWSGNAPIEMLCGLLGDTDGISEIRTFIDGSSSLAFHQFAAESLMPPGVASFRNDDPQPSQAANRIRQRLANGRKAHVLDFAAGTGRLIAAIANTPDTLRELLSYHAYNDADHTSEEDSAECRRHLAKIVPSGSIDVRYIDDIRALRNSSFQKMDVVILCNVLHEIDAHAWPQTFKDIAGALSDDGTVLILEDQQMSVGELPHDKGFLVLDKIELEALFDVKPDEKLGYELVHHDRLSLAEISLDQVRRCSRESVQNALERVRERSLKHIRKLRTPGNDSHRSGRLHAYFSLLHTNASLALEGRDP